MIQIDRNTEIRHLPSPITLTLAKHLQSSWKKLMSIIPKDLNENGTFSNENKKKYSNDHIKLIENHSNLRQDGFPIILLFEEWGTSGKIRPTLGHLFNLLVREELFQAADYISTEIFKENVAERPKVGPAARIDITLDESEDEEKEQLTQVTTLNGSTSHINSGLADNQNKDNTKGYSNINKVPLQPGISTNTISVQSTPINVEIHHEIPTILPPLINIITASNNTTKHDNSIHHHEYLQSEINSNYLPNISLLEMQNSSVASTNVTSELTLSSSSRQSEPPQQYNQSTEYTNHPDLSLFNSITNTNDIVTQNRNNSNNSDNFLPNVSLLQSNNDDESINSNSSSYIPRLNSRINNTNNSIYRSEMHVSLTSSNNQHSMLQSNSNFLPNLSELNINSNNSIDQCNNEQIIPNLSAFNIESEQNVNLNNNQNPFILNSYSSSNIPATINFSQSSQDYPETINSKAILEFNYDDLKMATNNFNNNFYQNNINDGGRKLGSGGFSDVYLAVNLTDNLPFCAVKRLNFQHEKYLEKFYNEINYLSQSQHRNIVKLFGYSRNHVELCLVYEYIADGNLYEKLKKCRENFIKFDWKKRLIYSIEIVNGIKFLHDGDLEIVHRDIKTTNILLNDDIPIICDFGLIKAVNSTTTTNASGTSCYMSPESIRGTISTKTDVYSFGVVLLELLTGLDVYDKKRSEPDLVTFFETKSHNTNYVEILTDWSAGDWNKKLVAQEMFDVALLCLKPIKIERPCINDIKIKLDNIFKKYC